MSHKIKSNNTSSRLSVWCCTDQRTTVKRKMNVANTYARILKRQLTLVINIFVYINYSMGGFFEMSKV